MPYYFNERSAGSDLKLSYILDREWILTRGQGGVFADRYSFDRMNAEQYDWAQQSNGCGEYVKVKSGFLDVGVHTSDFYSVPISLAGDGEKALQFINSVRPPLDTCVDQYSRTQLRADAKLNDDNEILFFHETNPDQTQPSNQKKENN